MRLFPVLYMEAEKIPVTLVNFLPTTVKSVLSSHSNRTPKVGFQYQLFLMQVKVLQNAPRGAFCNTFDLH